MFIAQDPHIPSLHDRLNVNVGSISFLILINASSTIGPVWFKSIVYDCSVGFLLGSSGFHLYILNSLFITGFCRGVACNATDDVENRRALEESWEEQRRARDCIVVVVDLNRGRICAERSYRVNSDGHIT